MATLNMCDVKELKRVLCVHYILLKSKGALDQLREGLGALGVSKIRAANNSCLESFVTYKEEEDLTTGARKCPLLVVSELYGTLWV